MSSLDNFSLPGDVTASARYWERDIIDPEVVVDRDGRISQSNDSGIGYSVNEARVAEFTVRSQAFTS
jgi:O-succinylbenzoate synthase